MKTFPVKSFFLTSIAQSGTGGSPVFPTPAPITAAAAPAPFLFLQPGTYRITTPSTTLTLHACTATLNPAPTAIQNVLREWIPTQLPDEAVMYSDDNLQLLEIAKKNNRRAFQLQSKIAFPQRILARLGEEGPILDTVVVNTLQNASQTATKWDAAETYPDGTVLWKATLYIGGIIPADFRVKLTMYKAGSLFDDGLPERWISAEDFAADGTYTYYMLLPPSVTGSSCHSAIYYDGGTLISTQL